MIWPGLISGLCRVAALHPAYRVLHDVRPLTAALMILSTFGAEAITDEEFKRIEAIRNALGVGE